jgi:hypothetical protein
VAFIHSSTRVAKIQENRGCTEGNSEKEKKEYAMYHLQYLQFTLQTTLQRQNTEISKQIFPKKEYWGLSPNFHIHAPVSELYIPTIGLPILLKEICRAFLGLYQSLTET